MVGTVCQGFLAEVCASTLRKVQKKGMLLWRFCCSERCCRSGASDKDRLIIEKWSVKF